MSFKFKRFIVFVIAIICMFSMMVGCESEHNMNIELLKSPHDVVEKVENEAVRNTEPVVEVTEEQTEPPTEKPTEKVEEPTKPKEEPKQEVNERPKPTFYLSNYERQVVECIVMGESGGESYNGQVLVAQCILNACLKDGIQPSRVRTKYQYSGWNSNPSDSVKEAVSAVFDDGYKVTNEPILYFYSPKYCTSSWHESQRFVIEVGGHRFFAERSN